MSRRNARSIRLRHRPSRTVPALIVGILLLALGVALVWLSIARLANGSWPTVLHGPRDWLTNLRWDSPGVWGIGVAGIVVGLILLLCALVPGGYSALPIHRPGQRPGADDSGDAASAQEQEPVRERETVMSRRAVARLAKAQCEQIDGVGSAAATATTKHVHLSVRTPLRDTGDLPARITDGVRHRLEAVGLDPLPRISATIRSDS